jgi:hypothetical protein
MASMTIRNLTISTVLDGLGRFRQTVETEDCFTIDLIWDGGHKVRRKIMLGG